MKYYHDLYLKCDGLSLADASRKFSTRSRIFFELDPAHYLSTLGCAKRC